MRNVFFCDFSTNLRPRRVLNVSVDYFCSFEEEKLYLDNNSQTASGSAYLFLFYTDRLEENKLQHNMQAVMCVFCVFILLLCCCFCVFAVAFLKTFFRLNVFICLSKKRWCLMFILDNPVYSFLICPQFPLHFTSLNLFSCLGYEVVLISSATRFRWPHACVRCYCVEISSCYHENKLSFTENNHWRPRSFTLLQAWTLSLCSSLVVLASERRRAYATWNWGAGRSVSPRAERR